MKDLLKKHWPLIGIGVLVMVVGLYLFEAHYEIRKSPLLTDVGTEEGLKLKDIHYIQNDPGDRMKWTLDAEEVKFSKDKEFLSFKQFRLRLKPENKSSIELKGKRGDFDKNSGEINMYGDLRGYTENGYRIITQHILYQQKEGYLSTEEPVKISGPFFSVVGHGLYFNPEKETLKIISNVTTHINSDSFIL